MDADLYLHAAQTRHEVEAHLARIRLAGEELARRAAYSAQLMTEGRREGPRLNLVVKAVARQQGVSGYEREFLEEQARVTGARFDPFCPTVPWSMFSTRASVAGTGAAGGYLVPDTPTMVGEFLRGVSVVPALGVQTIDIPRAGDHLVPRESGAPAAAWVGEVGTATSTDFTLDTATLSPKPVAAMVTYSEQLALQSVQLDQFIARSLQRSVGKAVDAALLTGAGTGNQPAGVLNGGITVGTGTGLNLAGLLGEEEAVCNAGVTDESLRVVASADVRKLMAQRAYSTGITRPLWDGGTVLGHSAIATPACGTQSLLMGDFGQALIAFWNGGIQLSPDPYTGFKRDLISVKAVGYVDCAVLNKSALRGLVGIT